MAIATVNPATGERVREFPEPDDAAVEAALTGAARAAAWWRRTEPAERARLFARLADRLDAERERLAALATLEMGKTLQSARDEVAKCALACRHYAANAPKMLGIDRITADGVSGTVRYDPLGVVLAVMPWNFPFWQVIRAAVPALAAGNAMILKHASNVPQCALALHELFAAAGAPKGLFATLLLSSARVGPLIADTRVAAVTLTGSEHAGREVAAYAGRATKKCVLELGGSDPFLVLATADLERAALIGVTSRMLNNGQSCICAKRFIVVESVADEFERRVVERVGALTVGDPAEPDTDVGPLATSVARDDVATQVERTVAMGARLAMGGRPMEGPGWFYTPTVLTNVPADSPAATEEVFGPVAPIFRVRDTSAAIALANATRFGLGASVWTRDRADWSRCQAELDAGMVFVNAMVASDPRFPFGGVKSSGYGREVGLHGLREFVNVKTVRGEL